MLWLCTSFFKYDAAIWARAGNLSVWLKKIVNKRSEIVPMIFTFNRSIVMASYSSNLASAEFKVQCEEVMCVVIEVPCVVFVEMRERHWAAALASWQEYKDKLAEDRHQLLQDRVGVVIFGLAFFLPHTFCNKTCAHV